MADFARLNLSDRTLEAVSKLDFTQPTPVQEKAIPKAIREATSSPARKPGRERRSPSPFP